MTNWIIFFLAIQVIHFLGTWKLYQKAGRKAWEALIPIYNAVVLTKIINRPWWWVILLFIPIVNLMMFPAFWVETVRSFGKEKTSELFLAVLTLGFYIYYLNYFEEVTYNANRQLAPFTKAGEWTTAIVFAVVAATIVHTYFIRPYTIPTSSLEKTLLIGDYLFVSKMHYGAPTPATPLSFPMVHDTIPIPYTGIKFRSYIPQVQLPTFRLPGWEKIKRNDIVVFYWPTDTVRYFRDQSGIHVNKPLDKKSNYVKRCVAIAGDTLQIKNSDVYINGKLSEYPDRTKIQTTYLVNTKEPVNPRKLAKWGITEYRVVYQIPKENLHFYNNQINFKPSKNDSTKLQIEIPRLDENTRVQLGFTEDTSQIVLNLDQNTLQKLQSESIFSHFQQEIDTTRTFQKEIFPHDSIYHWNVDNYGPIYIPEKGKSVTINAQTLPFYQRIIKEYEHNTLKVEGNQIYINDQPTNSYTFKQNYYWMMGDNRHNSEDSRYWGFVPYDHVVGKPVFLWWSVEQFNKDYPKSIFQRIRWERIFTTVGGSGKPVSYLPYFIALVIAWYGYSFLRDKRNKEKSTE